MRIRHFALLPCIALLSCAPKPPATTTAAANVATADATLAERAARLGATDISTTAAPGGGITLGGKLDGRQFALSVPAGWKGDALVFAHGYSTPGTPVAVSPDPVGGAGLPGGGTMRFAYEDGVAVGHSAYDKDGLGVEAGTIATKRLRDFFVALGARRVYAAGDSMGGGIVVTLLETYPDAFVGGLARCGVVDDWTPLLHSLYEMRAAYTYLTRGTPYALPGDQDVRRSSISSRLPAGESGDPQQYAWGALTRFATPVLTLYAAAAKNPQGPEMRIVRQVTELGGFDVDPGSLAFPLVTVGLGADDIAATAGGVPYDNSAETYAPPGMSAAETRAFNAGIQRVKGDPAAFAYLRTWHKATGRIERPLVTMHNRIESLVPYAQEEALAAAVRAAGRSHLLAQYAVPPLRAPLPVGGMEAYTHCGFTPEQGKAAWEALHGWVETGKRPAADAVR